MLRDLLVGAVLFAIAAGSSPGQVNLPHPISQPGLVLEYDRAIYTIQRGIALQWSDPELYLHAFDRMSRTGTGARRSLVNMMSFAVCWPRGCRRFHKLQLSGMSSLPFGCDRCSECSPLCRV
jgi:hypothetical protein